ncbi:hypothetical protein XA68_14034 [Ophiocordyceps unilateralis]|uniref:Uncharacterized protein n=1 Tax=Ophiocordyceps unilateralis TaxID=268505 RepID=A0A2A9PAF7_OPHUN|nr:hypothetical protein XA68_14034 [Ophiocordyceps unilateralis]
MEAVPAKILARGQATCGSPDRRLLVVFSSDDPHSFSDMCRELSPSHSVRTKAVSPAEGLAPSRRMDWCRSEAPTRLSAPSLSPSVPLSPISSQALMSCTIYI